MIDKIESQCEAARAAIFIAWVSSRKEISSARARYGADYNFNFNIDYEQRLRYKPSILAREARVQNAPRGQGAV